MIKSRKFKILMKKFKIFKNCRLNKKMNINNKFNNI